MKAERDKEDSVATFMLPLPMMLLGSTLMFLLMATPASGQQELAEANVLDQQFFKLYQDGNYAEAIPLAQKALANRERVLGPEHPDVATSLNNLAFLYDATGKYAKAEPLYQRSLAIREKALGPDHPDVATSLSNLAELYRATGQYEKAVRLSQRSLTIRERVLGPEHPDVATSLNNLAGFYHATGQYAKAEPLYQRSLAIREQVLGPEHPSVATSLNNLAEFYRATGEYAKAEPYYQRSLAILEKVLGPEHPSVATTLNNLAILYSATGQAKAEPLYQRSLTIREKALGPEHPDVATILNNLAEFYRSTGQYAKAEPLYQRSLAIDEKALGSEHPGVAMDLNNLALLYEATGQYAKAEPLYQRSLAIYEKAFGPEHPEVAKSLSNLAAIYSATGQYAKAEPLSRRSLTIRERVLGPEHPDVATSLNILARVEVIAGQDARALGHLKKALRIEDRHIQDVFTFTSEDEKLTFIESIKGSGLGFLSFVHQRLTTDQQAIRDGLEVVLRRKGLVFDAQARTHQILKSHLSPEALETYQRLSTLRSTLAHLLLSKPQTVTADDYREQQAALTQQIAESEQRLAKQSALIAKDLTQRTITVDAIARQVPRNAALVEFVKLRDLDFVKGNWKSWRYVAFILMPSGDVRFVDLGEASVLDRRIEQAVKEIKGSLGSRGISVKESQGPSARHTSVLTDLYEGVWAPLETALGRADTVILSPDGALNFVPFAALTDLQARPLVERYRLTYVTSGRDLITTDGSPTQSERDLVLVANPAFGSRLVTTSRNVSPQRARDFQGSFDPLPGTAREAQEIPPLVMGRTGQKLVLEGSLATETTVKQTRSPRILHLATHGFFLSDEPQDFASETRTGSFERGVSVGGRIAPKRKENPLVRSGLAFAGANRAAEVTDGDDGILTALEITGMDLYGTDLVVLSACDTAVGEVKQGEGVFGLRRAFALAGAKNLLMSLWPVSDEVTANQMTAFYKNLQRLPPADALRQAQLETIKALKKQYNGQAPVALWAPFILQGGQALAAMKKRPEEMEHNQVQQSKEVKSTEPKPIEVAKAPTYEAPRQTAREIRGKDGAPMVLVPEGEFLYGDDKQRKSLPAFYMDKYEVSTAQYAKFMAAASAKEPGYWPVSVLVNNGQKPVVGVEWHEATAYCRHYGKRLPTEQEWEKAARGTDGRRYPWGNEEPTNRHANFNKCCDFKDYAVLVNVGSLEDGKSPFGVYDMAGNVLEWTSSDYDSSSKVLRGGSWANPARFLPSTYRSGDLLSRSSNLGFRCAQDVGPMSKLEDSKSVQMTKTPAYEAPSQSGREITGMDGAPMVLVPEGEFLYGDNKQRNSLSAFYMDKYETSTKLYAVFLQATSRNQPEGWSQQIALVGSGDRPVVNVTWQDAEAYCRQYGKRLPTEQEWEKAARGTDGRKYPWGNEEPTSRHALFDAKWNGYGTLAVLGSHEAGASPYGIQDLAGNVWEWTSSDYNSSNKVVRGGSWYGAASYLRSSYRGYAEPTYRVSSQGFRCVQDAS